MRLCCWHGMARLGEQARKIGNEPLQRCIFYSALTAAASRRSR